MYLSGPMDFVGSRIIEKFYGWRSILTPVLRALGVTVLDPWNKPAIRGHREYGKEGVAPSKERYAADFWTNKETRARFETDFWETVHIDCRMTDLADAVIAFVPTNIYSVGTVHEIVLARSQFKPVLMISPPVNYDFFPEIASLPEETKRVLKFYGLKENPAGIPSQWYGNVVGGNNMFDGFGWEALRFKADDFYETLMRVVMADAEPAADSPEHEQWRNVKAWVEGFAPLAELQGSVLSHISFREPDEEAMLRAELDSGPASETEYVWYNTPYTPKRSMLYQLFSIAAGTIPTKLNVIPSVDEDDSVEYRTYESIDDNWLLLSPE
jgi:hypothetical protein